MLEYCYEKLNESGLEPNNLDFGGIDGAVAMPADKLLTLDEFYLASRCVRRSLHHSFGSNHRRATIFLDKVVLRHPTPEYFHTCGLIIREGDRFNQAVVDMTQGKAVRVRASTYDGQLKFFKHKLNRSSIEAVDYVVKAYKEYISC